MNVIKRTSSNLLVGATLLSTSGCGTGLFVDTTPVIYVQNDTAAPLFAAGTASLDAPIHLIGTRIGTGKKGAVEWGGCYTGWLVLRESSKPSAPELGKHKVSLCDGDVVTVDSEYEIVVECADRSPFIKPEFEC